MKINSVSGVNFKAHYTNVDIGASSINGSLKIRTVDESGKTIAAERTTVFLPSDKRSEDSFERNVARKVADHQIRYNEEIKKIDPENKMFLTICYPGPKVAGKNAGFMLSNFYYDNDRKERFKRPISPQNIDRSIMGNGLNVAQTRHANDMAGAGACLLSKIKQKHPEILKEGNEIVYLYPGGGLGSGVISVDKDNIKVKPTEIQHIKKHGNENLSLEQSVGAHAIVSNFVDALNLKEDVRDKFASNVKAVCSYEEANRIHPISEPNYEISSAIAIDSYMNSLAELIATQVCALKAHDVVLTGPIAHGIRDSYNKTPGFSTWATNSDKTDDKFTQALRAKVHDSLTTVGKAILGESDNLNIYFINLVDNTDGAQILQKCDEVGEPTAWYNMHE